MQIIRCMPKSSGEWEFLNMPHSSYFFNLGYAKGVQSIDSTTQGTNAGYWVDELEVSADGKGRKRIVVCRELVKYLEEPQAEE